MNPEMKNAVKDRIFRLKENPAVRLMALPVVRAKRRRATRLYAASPLAARIRRWKGRYAGQRCFIIGNGASLLTEDLERLSGELTFASNRIYHMYEQTDWRPDFYVAFEPEFTRTNARMISQLEVKKARFLNLAGRQGAVPDRRNYWLNCTSDYCLKKLTTENIVFSDDISVRVGDAYSVTFTILQLAAYMGFEDMILLGVDHYRKEEKTASDHFYAEVSREYRTPTYVEGIEAGYRAALAYAKAHGIRIRNATRGGGLEVFPRVGFDSLLYTRATK